MKNFFFLICCLFSSIVFSQNAINDDNTISVVGVGTKSTFPNAAHITIAVRFVKPALRDAMNETQKTSKDVLTIIKKYVSDTTDIKVSLIYTDKEFKYDNAQKKEVFVGFESNQKIIFTLKDIKRMQDFTEEILKTKIYEIEKVAYFHTEAATFMKQAQELAVTDAIETTERLARAAKLKVGKITYLKSTNSPVNAINMSVNSGNLQTYNKSMGGEGVSASGQLLNYTANVNMNTKID
jgi:uncharacterized protein YggE